MSLRDISESELPELLTKNKIVIVDLWAPWCGPCKGFIKTLENLNPEELEIGLYKMNVDNNVNITNQLGIQTVPVVLYYKDGVLVSQENGAKSLPYIKEK